MSSTRPANHHRVETAGEPRNRVFGQHNTGHRGSLFGPEKTFGYSPHLALFKVADDAVFDYMILGELRNASRRVLARALGRAG